MASSLPRYAGPSVDRASAARLHDVSLSDLGVSCMEDVGACNEIDDGAVRGYKR